MSDIEKRMQQMMVTIDKSIQLTDNREDMLMLACAMMQRIREIFDAELGVEGRKKMFRENV